jgi:glycerol-3-phosphate dehydrogenase
MQENAPRRSRLLEGPFDLIVVGGGINGTAIARDATLRGKSVLLVEKGDLSGGTSSASSKMVHGGIRYLEQFRLGLVYESLRERHRLLKLAGHLVRPQSFLLPVYQGDPRPPWMIRLGLFLYDLLAAGKRLGRSTFLSPTQALERAPELLPDGLLGGGIYHDAVMNDARLCLLNAVGCAVEGTRLGTHSAVRNYAELIDYSTSSPLHVRIRDGLTGKETVVLGRQMVLALGPWSDPEFLVRSKGVHLVLPPWPTAEGLLLTHSRDGRVFFVIPWLDRTIVGTTETPFDTAPDALRVEPDEVAYLLGELRRLFPKLRIESTDILGTYAGVRPLAKATSRGGQPGSVSRKHRIIDQGNGVFTVVGGKYTTYRAVAEEVVDRLYPGSTCTTHQVPLPGADKGPWEQAKASFHAEIDAHGSVEVERLYHRYGSSLRDVLELARTAPGLGEPLGADVAELRAEVVHAVEKEFVVYPADFLERRTTLRYNQNNGRPVYDAVETLIQERGTADPTQLAAARARYFEACAWEDSLRDTVSGRKATEHG